MNINLEQFNTDELMAFDVGRKVSFKLTGGHHNLAHLVKVLTAFYASPELP